MRKLILILFLFFPFSAFSQNLPSGLHDWYLHTNDSQKIYVAEGGQGANSDSVIVLHGGFGAEYSYLVPALHPLFHKHYFIFYDQRGSLRSPAPDSTISMQRFVEDLNELRQEEGINKVTLLAHSMGTTLAYAYLSTYPRHVKSMILIGAIPPFKPKKATRLFKKSVQRMKKWAKPRIQKEWKEENLDRKNLTDKEHTKKWRIRFAGSNIYHIDRWRKMRGGHAFYNPKVAKFLLKNSGSSTVNLIRKLKKYHKPIYVIMGDHDLGDFGLKVWPDLVKKIPNMHLLVLKNAGHNSWIDRPGRFHDYVDYALQQIHKKATREE
jgi:pimeloyl-ACP methyl ester carboxylesterase